MITLTTSQPPSRALDSDMDVEQIPAKPRPYHLILASLHQVRFGQFLFKIESRPIPERGLADSLEKSAFTAGRFCCLRWCLIDLVPTLCLYTAATNLWVMMHFLHFMWSRVLYSPAGTSVLRQPPLSCPSYPSSVDLTNHLNQWSVKTQL